MPTAASQGTSPKSGLATFILCMFFGNFGIHRFYVRKIGTGILMLITFGGMGFWTLYDLFSIVCKTFTDKQGRLVEVAQNPTAPRNVVIVVFVIFAIFFSLAITIVGSTVSAISTTGKNELAALRQGNMELAYSYTSADFQKNVSVATFTKFVNSMSPLHDNVDSTFSDVEFKDNIALITGTLSMKDGSTIPLQINLVKENDQWKINELNIDIPKGPQPEAAPAKTQPEPAPAKAQPKQETEPAASDSSDTDESSSDDSSGSN